MIKKDCVHCFYNECLLHGKNYDCLKCIQYIAETTNDD